jgi:hypothetical protein
MRINKKASKLASILLAPALTLSGCATTTTETPKHLPSNNTINQSQEGYLELRIQERKTPEGIKFTLNSIQNLRGNYEGLVPTYLKGEKGPHTLTTLDSNGNVLNNYHIHSPRFIINDDFSEKSNSQIIEHPEGSIEAYIPNDPRISKITISQSNNNKFTVLKQN